LRIAVLFFTASPLPVEVEPPQLFFPIHFIQDYFAMLAKSTKEITSQSLQRNFLIRRKKFWNKEANQGTNRKMNLNLSVVLFLAPNVG